jgi:hypothetical protein
VNPNETGSWLTSRRYGARHWLQGRGDNAAVMTVLLLVIGVALIGKALGSL